MHFPSLALQLLLATTTFTSTLAAPIASPTEEDTALIDMVEIENTGELALCLFLLFVGIGRVEVGWLMMSF